MRLFLLVSNNLPKLKLTNALILSDPSRGPLMEKFLSQNPHFEIKSFTELVTEHLMKFQKEIDSYFLSLDKDELAYIRNPFIANA